MSVAAIKRRIIRKGRGAVFTPSDFLALGSRSAVDKALSRLAADGVIRRLTQGVYDYPKVSTRLGALAPNPDDVAAAIAAKGGHVVQVSPAKAANLLGLTTQVPAKSVYLTDGPTRSKKIGRQTIYMRNAAPKNLVAAGKPAGLIFQALRYLGKDCVDERAVRLLSQNLDAATRKALVKDSQYAPGWVRPIAHQIAEAA
ncbi:MAG: DUF6088 family protein [Pseudomonadota bacterium]